MENDPVFNAGYGASLTRMGTVELDSMIMRGRDLQIGKFEWFFIKNVQFVKLVRKIYR